MSIEIPAGITFEKWPKIERLKKIPMTITEKIDGTNAQIVIQDGKIVGVGSRNRWIKPGNNRDDNYGFAQWVAAWQDVLIRLGDGTHYGEWYGIGIGRNYGLTERRFALFDFWRYPDLADRGLPPNVETVPVLYRGALNLDRIDEIRTELATFGSRAVTGWMKPEGVVVSIGSTRYKVIFDKQGPSPEE